MTVLCTGQTLRLGIQNLNLVLVSGYLKEKKKQEDQFHLVSVNRAFKEILTRGVLAFRIQGASCNSPRNCNPVSLGIQMLVEVCLFLCFFYSLGHNVLLSVHLFYFKIYWLAFCSCKIPLLIFYKFDLLVMWLAPVLILAPSPNKLMSQITRLIQALCLIVHIFDMEKNLVN